MAEQQKLILPQHPVVNENNPANTEMAVTTQPLSKRAQLEALVGELDPLQVLGMRGR